MQCGSCLLRRIEPCCRSCSLAIESIWHLLQSLQGMMLLYEAFLNGLLWVKYLLDDVGHGY